jgi:MFS family permease
VFSRVFVGPLADRLGRKPVLLLGAIIAAIMPVLYGAVHSIPGLIAVGTLRGVSIAAFTTGFQALLADLAPPARRGEVFGLGNNSGAIGALVGPLMGNWLMTRHGFGAAFGLSAISGGLCTLAAILIREPRHESHSITVTPPFRGLRETLAIRNVQTSLIAISPMGMAFGTMITFWPLVARQNHLGTAGAFYSVYAVGLLSVQILAGRLADRVGRTTVMLPGMALTGLAFGLVPQAHSDVASLLIAFGCGAGLGIARTAMDALVLDDVPGTVRGTAVALEFTLNDLWIGLGSALMGSGANRAGFGAAYAIVCGACITIAGVLAARSRRK